MVAPTLAGLAVVLVALFLLRRGLPQTAMLLGWIAIFANLFFLHRNYGRDASGWVALFPAALATYFVYRPEQWAWRLLPLTLCLLIGALTIIPADTPPLVPLPVWEERVLAAVNVLGCLYATAVLASHAAAFREAARRRMAEERNRADRLLLNILLPTVATRLLQRPDTIADSYETVTVLFADLVGFTRLSATLSSHQLVAMLNELFSELDQLAVRHGLEKIKTIGDAYMAAAGLAATASPEHVQRAVRMAADMHAAVAHYSRRSGLDLALRIGMHCGPLTAGVIGVNKLAYDLWGETVNLASRMESTGEPARTHVTAAVYAQVAQHYPLAKRREIDVKGIGPIETWLLP